MTTKEQILAEIERRKRRQGKSYYPAMMELLSILDILPDEPVEKTCKTCGFYENNCPFIRGKFIPYPSKVCKDYTFSTLKAEPVSEDERIRKEIIEVLRFVPSSMWEQAKTNYERCFSYLEKQKEPKWSPSEGEMGVLYKLCYISNQITDEDDTELTRLYQDLKREYFNGHSFENMFSNEKQKEQKTPMSNDLDEEIERFFDECIEAHDAKIYGVDKQVITVDCYELTARHFAQWQKEQKPMHNLEISAGDVAPAEEDGTFNEDEFLENELSAFLQNYDKEYDDDAVVSDVAKHFYELAKKVKQKPAEWSEEDEKFAYFVNQFLEYHEKSDPTAKSCKDWFNDRLKSLRPKSHWKPSEEQMKALNAINCHGELSYFGQQSQLISLYNNLKKLM